MAVLALIALGELALIYERYAASRDAAKRLAQRKSDLQLVTQLTPPPKREIAATIEADLTKAQSALASMQSELKGRGPYAETMRSAKIPAARTDSFFDLATFVERTRELARKNEVTVAPEAARFGFAVYANEGPVPGHIEPVFRQRQVAQYLVEALIDAKPRAISGVKRERTVPKADREAQAQALANGEQPPELELGEDGPDYFTVDPRVTARMPGYLDTTGFRFVFTGQTAALRTFLNRLASFELPILVREVEVESTSAEEAASSSADDSAAPPAVDDSDAPASVVLSLDGTEPAAPSARKRPAPATASRSAPPASTLIVSKQLSKFTVTVEFVELVPPKSESEGTADAAPPPT